MNATQMYFALKILIVDMFPALCNFSQSSAFLLSVSVLFPVQMSKDF